MFDQNNDRANQAIEITRKAINDVRVLIWAGNYTDARRLIDDVITSFRDELAIAIELRKTVVKAEREIRGEIPDEEKTLSMNKIRAMDTASKQSSKIIAENESYFSLGALANILSKLDKRIAEQTDEKPRMKKILSKLSSSRGERQLPLENNEPKNRLWGFSYIPVPLDENKIEFRAYRLHSSSSTIREIEQRLLKTKNFKLRKWDNALESQGKATFPYRYIGFSDNLHIEVTILDLNRVKIYIASDREIDANEILLQIFKSFE